MIVDILRDLIQSNIGPLKPASKNFSKRNCFLCHTQGHGLDKRERFGVQFNATSIIAHCFNCGFKARFEEGKSLSKNFKLMLKELSVPEKSIKDIELEIFRLNVAKESNVDVTQIKSLTNIQQTRWCEHKLPSTFLTIQEWVDNGLDDDRLSDAIEYLAKRRIFEFNKFYWTYEEKHELSSRVVLPYYYRGKIVGYTARLFDKKLESNGAPKYFQHCPTDFVYNLDAQEDWHRKIVIVTEGVLDAYVVDGVAILGEMNSSKADSINRLQKRVIVMPDRDKKGQDLVEHAVRNGWEVSFPKWDMSIKDAAKAAEVYGRLLSVQSIIESAISDKDQIMVKWRMEQDDRERLYRRL